jgi:hypothetical protein
MKKSEELVVITKTYDLILWSCNHTSRFPRQHRFVLGERLERNLYDLLVCQPTLPPTQPFSSRPSNRPLTRAISLDE